LQRLLLQLGELHPHHRYDPELNLQAWTDPFQRRIEQVRAASARLQNLEETQRETLAFVSHDIRVPLASAVIQIQQELGERHPVHQQLERALRWTEEFLQTSRAQMLSREKSVEIDIVALLHEAVDEIYPLAQKAQLQLQVSLPERPHWVYGDAEMLLRAVSNLLVNALKVSAPGRCVGLQAYVEVCHFQIRVTDQGPGIPIEDQASMFKRFSRPQGQNHQTGAGLGLYFVQTVVHNHGGAVQYRRSSEQTCFDIRLPLTRQ
jgi:signal transduction histidine kinase